MSKGRIFAALLGLKRSEENSRLLPLSFHVNYLNCLGWKDPYSSPANTDRQRGYASALDGQVYTPELIINGATGVLGSDEEHVREAIEDVERNNDAAHVTISHKRGISYYAVLPKPANYSIQHPTQSGLLWHFLACYMLASYFSSKPKITITT